MVTPGRGAVTERTPAPITDPAGRFAILAIDHRDSLRRFLAPDDPDSLDAADITALKVALVAGVGDLASGVMLEPEYSIPQILDAGVLPDGVGFLAALEAQGYSDDPGAAPTTILSGWSIEQVGPNIGGTPNSMTLDSDPKSDQIMLSVQDSNSDLNYVLWDGNTWGTPSEQEVSTGETGYDATKSIKKVK